MARAAAADESSAITDRNTYRITDNPGWPVSKAALLDMAQQCEQAGIPFLVAMYGRPGPVFRTELEEENMDILDLSPAWSDVPEGRAHVSRIDPHPSVEVHEKIAVYLVDALRKQVWYREQ